jgi:hypothetical protein
VAQVEDDRDRAASEYWAAGELPPEDWLTLAALERLRGRDERAREALAQALAADPSARARLASDPVLGPLLR